MTQYIRTAAFNGLVRHLSLPDALGPHDKPDAHPGLHGSPLCGQTHFGSVNDQQARTADAARYGLADTAIVDLPLCPWCVVKAGDEWLDAQKSADTAVDSARRKFEAVFSVSIHDDQMAAFREVIETAAARLVADLKTQRDALTVQLEMPCGYCHPCSDKTKETA